jgi:transposase
VECAEHGVVVEHIPWSDGKRPVTCAMMGFLARWARRLSWRETAQVFQTSWEAVYRSVEWFVQWGLANRELQQVESLGVDEIHWGHGLRADNFLTVIYQIDAHCRRLLWVGKRRSEATLRRGLKVLGPEVVQGLRFVCSDMWKPYLKVIAAEAEQALHVLDRFHITTHLNQAVDQVRRSESSRLRAMGKARAQRLKHMRWPLLRRGSRVRGRTGCAAGQQDGHGTGLGVEGNFLSLLALQVRTLGRSLSGLLVLSGHAQPSGAHAESRPHASRP